MQPGLVSISFRNLSPVRIIELCQENHLQVIEWGGDIHVPHGDLATAKSVGEATREAGLHPGCYGSYFRLGKSAAEGLSFQSVIDTAEALGAPSIRIWPGTQGSAETTDRQSLIDEALTIADLAAQKNITIAYECHRDTLTDTTESMVDLLEKTDHPFIKTLWQPYIGLSMEECADSLQAILPRLLHLHVYHWYPETTRQPLSEGQEPWLRYLSLLPRKDYPLLLEFVRNNTEAQLAEDARTLNQLIADTK